MEQCSQTYTHKDKEYRCIRGEGHDGSCIPTVFFEDPDHHLTVGMDFELQDGSQHCVVVTAQHNPDGTITVLSVDEWDDQVHPQHVPAGE